MAYFKQLQLTAKYSIVIISKIKTGCELLICLGDQDLPQKSIIFEFSNQDEQQLLVEECIKGKNMQYNELMGKFVLILNTKKKYIRQLVQALVEKDNLIKLLLKDSIAQNP